MNYRRARWLRRSKDLTQAQLAGRIGIAAETLSRWESGERVPNADYLGRWAAALEVSADELLDDEQPATPRGAA